MSKQKVPKVLSQQGDHEAHVITHTAGHELRDPLVIQFSEYRGQNRVSLRFHYVSGAGDLVPTRRGIEFTITLIDDVIEALQKTREEFDEMGDAVKEIPI